MTIARDGFREIGIALLLLGPILAVAVWAALTHSAWWWLAVPVPAFFLGFTFAFFRDPQREIPSEPGVMVAPADGTITHVERLEATPEIAEPVWRISIFLSVFNVHINRAPCAAAVTEIHYAPGQYLDARDPNSARDNEQNALLMRTEQGGATILVRQIAGLIARRIICHAKEGTKLKRGERFGMIKFGSRTDLVVPVALGLEPVVQVGQKVQGGATVMMRNSATSDLG